MLDAATKEALTALATLLMDDADTLERWVKDTLSGGWSTQLIDEQRKMAAGLRVRAAKIYRLVAQ